MSGGRTISEKIMSRYSGQDLKAGDVVVCTMDYLLGTDGSAPMAIDYFHAMRGPSVFAGSRVAFSLDHYAPPASATTAALHDKMRQFAREHGITIWEVGEGIGLQLAVEYGLCVPGGLVLGADSHSVMFGALNCFSTGIGSSDLAAAMICGQTWLRVPESIRVVLEGALPRGVFPKDIILALAGRLGSEGANYRTLEFAGDGVAALTLEDRLVIANMGVELGAKAALFPADAQTTAYLTGRTSAQWTPVQADADAHYAAEVVVPVHALVPQIAVPHEPNAVLPLDARAGVPIHMAFLGTCMGGRVRDIHQALDVLVRGGGPAPGVQLVVTPASREILQELQRDGSLTQLVAMGAVITTPGCGACCGTSGMIPGAGTNVISTANRNFKGRMGNAAASIYLASPASVAAAAVAGRVIAAQDIAEAAP